jgi:conjugal transfer pilus assembly protein TraV
MRRLCLLVLAWGLLAGCSSLNPYKNDFGCEGHPEGVNCKSAREVYRLTDYKDALGPEDMKNSKDKKNRKQEQQPRQPSASPAPDPAAAAVQGLGYEGPIPLRTSAQVMRIWLAPFESQDGALHMPSYLYVEVAERKWGVGEAKMEVAPQITPLQVEAVEPPENAPAGRPQPQQGRGMQGMAKRPSLGPLQPGALIRLPARENSKVTSPSPGFGRPFGQDSRQNLLGE